MEWYDFAIYAALGVVITPLFLPTRDPDLLLLATFSLYATAFLLRPMGAVLFGRWADAHGRQGAFVTVLVLMSVATAAVGLLPVYATVGIIAPVALLMLRAVQGVAAGGELGLAAVFIAESAPKGRRGSFGAWHAATLALGLATGLGVGGLVQLLPSEMVQAGWWRAPLLIAVPLGLVGIYLRRSGQETVAYVGSRRAPLGGKGTVRQVWSSHRRGALTGFSVIAAGSLTFNTFFVFLPNHLVATGQWAASQTLFAAVIGLLATAASALGLGALSDRTGRRPVVLGSLLVLVVAAAPLMLLTRSEDLRVIVLVEVIAGLAIGGVLSVALLTEMFPTAVRATGLGLTAGLATALIGGTAPLVDQLLVVSTGRDLAPAAYVAAVAAISFLVLWRWPETAFRDLD